MFDKITRRPFILFDADAAGGTGNTDADKKKGDDPGDGDAKDQKALDKQFAERSKRAADAERKKFLDALGLKDEQEFQDYLKAKQDAEDKQKSETQKLADQAKKAQEKADKAEAEAKTMLETMQKRIVDTEIKVAASTEAKDKEGKVVRAAFRPEALGDILLLIDRSKIEEKDGTITGIDKALAELAKTKPYLLVDEAQRPGNKGTPLSRAQGNQAGKGFDNNQKPDRLIRSL